MVKINKNIIKEIDIFKKKENEIKKMLNKNFKNLTDKQILDLDKKTDKLNSENAKRYINLRDKLINLGFTKKKAHNLIMK